VIIAGRFAMRIWFSLAINISENCVDEPPFAHTEIIKSFKNMLF